MYLHVKISEIPSETHSIGDGFGPLSRTADFLLLKQPAVFVMFGLQRLA
jgi:hypothetical protein